MVWFCFHWRVSSFDSSNLCLTISFVWHSQSLPWLWTKISWLLFTLLTLFHSFTFNLFVSLTLKYVSYRLLKNLELHFPTLLFNYYFLYFLTFKNSLFLNIFRDTITSLRKLIIRLFIMIMVFFCSWCLLCFFHVAFPLSFFFCLLLTLQHFLKWLETLDFSFIFKNVALKGSLKCLCVKQVSSTLCLPGGQLGNFKHR